MNMTKIINDFNVTHAPRMIACILVLNIWIFVSTLFPVFSLGMPALMLGLSALIALVEIDDQPLADVIGKRVGAVFGKNNLISLISLFVISVGHQLLLLKYTWL